MPKLKKNISCIHFQSDDDVIHVVEDFLDSQEKDFIRSGIESLQHRWQKYIDIEGIILKNNTICLAKINSLLVRCTIFFNQSSYLGTFITEASC